MAKKDTAKTTWTPEQDALLRRTLEDAQGTASWGTIAATAFPGGEHDKLDCTERWKVLGKPRPLRGPWTKEEDAKLQALVDQHGSEKWVIISAEMGSRTGKQCRERWHNHLDPTINKGEWTAEEEELIHQMYRKIGSRWAEMAKHLPGRPDNAIKNFYNASLVREKRKRGGSISSMAGALDLGAEEQPASAPTMSRSASSHSLSGSISGSSRFGPYVRSSPMTKSRSESIGSLAAFSPMRGPSVEQVSSSTANSPTMNPSPHRPAAMMRSHSSLSSFSPPMTKTKQAQASGLPVSRDLSDTMREPSLHHADDLRVDSNGVGRRDGETSPAPPHRPPFRHHHSTSVPSVPLGTYAYDPPPPSPPMSVAVEGPAFYTGSSLHPEFDSGPSWSDDQAMDTYAEDYEQTLASLQLTDAQVKQQQFAPEPQYTYPEQQVYSPPLSGHSQTASEPSYQSNGYTGHHSLGHSASVESMHPTALYGEPTEAGMPYVHPLHLVSMEQPQVDYGSAGVDEWGNVLAPNGNTLSHSYSSHSLGQPSPIEAPSPGSDFYGHGTRSGNSSAASSPYYPYSPGVEDVPEEPLRKPTLPRRGSVPTYHAFPSPSSSSSSIYAPSQGPHHQHSFTSLSAGTIPHSHSTPAALSSFPASPTPTSTKISKPPLSSSASYHSNMRRISRPSSLSLSSTLEPPIDLSTPLASPSLYRPSLEQEQSTPRANALNGRATAASMSRGYSSPGGESVFNGGAGGGLRIKTEGHYTQSAGMARSATVSGGLGSGGMLPSPSWAGSRSSISTAVNGGAVKAHRAHPTSDLMGVDQHGRACLPGITG